VAVYLKEKKHITKIKMQAACGFEVGYFIMIAFLLGAHAHEYHLSVAQ